jgi:hypothetical protein
MSTCGLCVIYAYFLVPETKGLSLEQVDRMFEESTPRTSSKWKPHSTYAHDVGLAPEQPKESKHEIVEDVTKQVSPV